MKSCECLEKCPFFNDKMENMPSMADMYKREYCQGSFSDCARYMVFSKLGRPAVPPGLFPYQQDVAKKIISASAE